METKAVDHNLPFDSKIQRLKKRYQGLARVAAAINDLSIYGVFTSNYPNLTIVLEHAKDHCKQIIYQKFEEVWILQHVPRCHYKHDKHSYFFYINPFDGK